MKPQLLKFKCEIMYQNCSEDVVYVDAEDIKQCERILKNDYKVKTIKHAYVYKGDNNAITSN